MPIIRKIIKIGDSKAITLPKSWLKFFEKKIGFPIEAVAIEVDNQLTVVPYIPKKKGENKNEK